MLEEHAQVGEVDARLWSIYRRTGQVRTMRRGAMKTATIQLDCLILLRHQIPTFSIIFNTLRAIDLFNRH